MVFLQSVRFCSLATVAGDEALLVREAVVDEAVSGGFRAVVEVETEQFDLEPQALLGTGATLGIATADGDRLPFHGLVVRCERRGRTERFASYRLELRPWTWLLQHRHDCRIFQGLTVPQIVAKVCEGLDQRDFALRVGDGGKAREFCVQYRESDHDFVNRLLEEEGLFTCFEHTPGRHVLVVTDRTTQLPECPGQPDVDYHPLDAGQFGRDVVHELVQEAAVASGSSVRKDFWFVDPGNALLAQCRGGRFGRLEVYDYHPGEYRDHADGARLARLRQEGHEAGMVRLRGRSDCRAFRCGHRFTLHGHPQPDLDGAQLLLLTVHHEVRQPSAFAGPEADGEPSYRNEFTATFADRPYRPPLLTRKPVIAGPQTAFVVGPAGEEIHVDAYGRIRVQFHWDRLGKRDERSSCWVRVAQVWAGKQWGAVFHPRIGDEVIVEFLEGDPDQPIVTGCVYNAASKPPYELPANKTQSGIKTHSTPRGGAGNHNELRFEDKKGKEQVYLQAEKDLQFLVKNDHSGQVGRHEQVGVGGNRSASVGGNETTAIGGNRSETVGGDESVQIGGSELVVVGATSTEQIGAVKMIQAGASVVIQAGTSITLQCGASTLHMNQAGVISLSGMLVNIQGSAAVNVMAPLATVSGVVLTLNGAIASLNGASTHVNGTDLVRVAGAKVAVAAKGECVVKGTPIQLN